MPARRRDRLSAAAARRVALAAQGFGPDRPGTSDTRALTRAIRRIGLLQLDSVNVLVRAHYLPLFSRLGGYDRALLDAVAWGPRRQRRLFEYWAHEASLLPVSTEPLLRWRQARATEHAWGGMREVAERRPRLLAQIVALLGERGPLTAGEIERLLPAGSPGPAREPDWGWNWSDVKRAVEFLFWAGQVTAASRVNFTRRYDLPERVLPAEVLARPTPAEDEAVRGLVELGARAHGVATAACLRDYFRLPADAARRAVAELVEDGVLLPVAVEGWRRPAYLHHHARVPRAVRACALLAPFDPLVFERARVAELFGFQYRLEIYTPAARRVHGYYVLPFLLGDTLVARVDLKADRSAAALRVQGAFAEPHAPAETASRLAEELVRLAGWLGLAVVQLAEPARGDLAAALAAALRQVG